MNENFENSTVNRRKKILNLLTEQGQVHIQSLSNDLKVSEVTIRHDLDQLEKQHMLIRARGGAIKINQNVAQEQYLSEKNKINFIEKSRIGKKAAQFINDFETIILDSGTTTMEIIRNLPPLKNVTIISNAMNIVNQLMANEDNNINIVVPGGFLRTNSNSLVGSFAEANLRNMYVDKVFLGVDGFDIKQGIFTPNIEEAHLNQIMIEIAKEVIIVTDSSKFLKKSFAFICDLSKIDIVITDDKISEEYKKRLEDNGIRVEIA